MPRVSFGPPLLRLLLDNMLSPWLAEHLSLAGHDAVHVRELGMSLATDSAILAPARDDGRTIISADSDFSSLLAFHRWEKPCLLLLRDIPRAREEILALRLDNLPTVAEAIEQGSIVTFKRGRFRIRRLPIRG